MRPAPVPMLNIAAAAACVGIGVIAGRYVPLRAWEPALPGLLVALSMMGAAALVRLARNAPITSPAAFDEDDLKRFFDTLHELSTRLLWLFYQVVLAVIVVIVAMIGAKAVADLPPSSVKALSGLMAGLFCWLITRLFAMAKGDIGFLKLQREILENALARERKKAAEKTISAPVQFRSPGGYGRAV